MATYCRSCVYPGHTFFVCYPCAAPFVKPQYFLTHLVSPLRLMKNKCGRGERERDIVLPLAALLHVGEEWAGVIVALLKLLTSVGLNIYTTRKSFK